MVGASDNAQAMSRQLPVFVLLLLAGATLQAQCVPGPNHHCVGIKGFGYTPNQLTVIEGDTVEFAASSFHPLRQVIRAFPSTTAVVGGLVCTVTPCIKVMDGRVFDADGLPVFHYICVNHIQDVMRGDITVLPRTIFASNLED
jgi:plastocyanin